MRNRHKTGRIVGMDRKKRICLSIAAHVDAGKTTLAEAMLFEAGKLKTRGRVDHRDSALDYEDFERARGITAFSKQAVFSYGSTEFSVIDTPGHADLFAETERGLRVPDAAVLVISGSEGVQADTGTIWDLLEKQNIPVWIFVSKMDLPGCGKERILSELKERLSDAVTDFSDRGDEFREDLATLDEDCMQEYLDTGKIPDLVLMKTIADRKVFPCFFGSGLHLDGVRAFLAALDRWTAEPEWQEPFSALCYKISRDARGQRMTQVKITGGSLSVRDSIRYPRPGRRPADEKITGIRICSGARFETVDRVSAGQVCSLLGLTETAAGTILGNGSSAHETASESVRRYQLAFDPPQDPTVMLAKLKQLSEELPELRPEADRRGLTVCLSGRMQSEMFRSLVRDRFDVSVTFSEGRLVYHETVGKRVEGIGHFEPLRHYAEVHLVMEPLPRGSGLQIESSCSEDQLDRNWQNLILDALRFNRLPGVLTGAELTDTRIRLVSGRAHPKHTEGGDFREATLRALRNGLMQAECLLLEPVSRFVLTVPAEQLGRAISDLRTMHAVFSTPEQSEYSCRIEGNVPASEVGDYAETLLSYTHGRGKLSLHPAGYQECHDQENVVQALGYDPERDTDWPSGSVFCAHGAGFYVAWNRVRDYMHLPSVLDEQNRRQQETVTAHRLQRIDDRELEAIMLREFGPVKRPQWNAPGRATENTEKAVILPKPRTVVVDGYNFIFAEPELKMIASENLDAARSRLLDRLSNYCGYTGQTAIAVFDGFRTAGNPGSRSDYANIHIVFTPEGETADAYIERLASEVGKNDRVCVVTADTMIRISAMRSGVLRISPNEFMHELETAEEQLTEILFRSNLLAHQTQGIDAVSDRDIKKNLKESTKR